MIRHHRLFTILLLGALYTASGASLGGCDLLKAGDKAASDEDTDIKPETRDREDEGGDEKTPAPTAEASAADAKTAEPSASAEAPASVASAATYFDMTSVRGHARLLKAFNIYQAADATSERYIEYPKDKYVDLRQQRGDWLMVDWVDDAGTTKQGWIEAKLTDPGLKIEALPDEDAPVATTKTTATAPTATATASATPTATASATIPTIPTTLPKIPKLKLKLPVPPPKKTTKPPMLKRQ